jgi:hypothetical protein
MVINAIIIIDCCTSSFECCPKPPSKDAKAALHDLSHSSELEAAVAFAPVDGPSQAKGQGRKRAGAA